MGLQWKVTQKDVDIVRRSVVSTLNDDFVQRRMHRNVTGVAPAFSRDEFWFVMVGCLMTTQQRSTNGSFVNRFLSLRPFPIALTRCQNNDLEEMIPKELKVFGGIRRGPTIARQAHINWSWLETGGWASAEEKFQFIAQQRSIAPLPGHAVLERQAAHFIDANLQGFGPKQSRNLWQWLGLTRYEIPIDSRVASWVNNNLSIRIDRGRLSDVEYYEGVVDYVQAVCAAGDVLPCILDATAFNFNDSNGQLEFAWESILTSQVI
jgi:hypothetical protein